MSNPLTNYRDAIALKGLPNLAPASVFECSPKQGNQPPQTIAVTINWNDYKNQAGSASPIGPIAVNLQGGVQGAGAPIDSLRSIKINNLGCQSPITVFFPDTGDEISCAGFSTVRSNVLTGGYQCIVFTQLSTSSLGKQTTIFFNNFQMDAVALQDAAPVENLEQSTGSPFVINVLSPRAKGDRTGTASLSLALTGVASRVPLFAGPPDGYNLVVLSEVHFTLLGNYIDSATPSLMSARIVDDNVSVYLTWNWYSRNDLGAFYGNIRPYEIFNSQQGMTSFAAPGTFRKLFLQNDVTGVGLARLDYVYTLVNFTNF